MTTERDIHDDAAPAATGAVCHRHEQQGALPARQGLKAQGAPSRPGCGHTAASRCWREAAKRHAHRGDSGWPAASSVGLSRGFASRAFAHLQSRKCAIGISLFGGVRGSVGVGTRPRHVGRAPRLPIRSRRPLLWGRSPTGGRNYPPAAHSSGGAPGFHALVTPPPCWRRACE